MGWPCLTACIIWLWVIASTRVWNAWPCLTNCRIWLLDVTSTNLARVTLPGTLSTLRCNCVMAIVCDERVQGNVMWRKMRCCLLFAVSLTILNSTPYIYCLKNALLERIQRGLFQPPSHACSRWSYQVGIVTRCRPLLQDLLPCRCACLRTPRPGPRGSGCFFLFCHEKQT